MNYEDKKRLAFEYLINKMLKPHGVDYEYVSAHPKIKKRKCAFWAKWVDWYEYYTWTRADQEEFTTEAIDYIRKTLKYSKQRSTQIVAMFILQYGLKCSDYKLK